MECRLAVIQLTSSQVVMTAVKVPRLSQFAHIKRDSSARVAISCAMYGMCFVFCDVEFVNLYEGVGRGVFLSG